MSPRITVETCFAIVLTVLSATNANSVPETRKELRYKPADTEQSSHDNKSRITKDNLEGSQNEWDIPYYTSRNSGSSEFQRPGAPFMSSTFETRTEVLQLKDRNIIRYHLSETSAPSSQSPRTSAYVKQDKGNTLSYSLPSPGDSRMDLRDSTLIKSSNEVVTSPSSPPTVTTFQDYKPHSFFHLPSKRFSRDGQHDDTPDLYGLSYLFAQEAQGLLNDDTEPQGLTSHSRYQSDSTDSQRPFPRFSIPLGSLQLDSERSKDYNTETSEIIEPTFIVPRDIPRQLVPRPTSPTMTYGVSISDGEFSRKEIRKDNGEFFSRYCKKSRVSYNYYMVGKDGWLVDLDVLHDEMIVTIYRGSGGEQRGFAVNLNNASYVNYRDHDVSSADVGSLVAKADGDQVLVLRGSYSFTSPEGLRFRTDYTADETGFHATQVPVVEDADSVY